MPGFSREIQNTLGLMLRLQRGKLKTHLIEDFPRRLKGIEINILLLRIAIILERSRDWDASRKIKIKRKKNTIKLKFPKLYLEAHPLTRADLEQEIQESAKLGFELVIK